MEVGEPGGGPLFIGESTEISPNQQLQRFDWGLIRAGPYCFFDIRSSPKRCSLANRAQSFVSPFLHEPRTTFFGRGHLCLGGMEQDGLFGAPGSKTCCVTRKNKKTKNRASCTMLKHTTVTRRNSASHPPSVASRVESSATQRRIRHTRYETMTTTSRKRKRSLSTTTTTTTTTRHWVVLGVSIVLLLVGFWQPPLFLIAVAAPTTTPPFSTTKQSPRRQRTVFPSRRWLQQRVEQGHVEPVLQIKFANTSAAIVAALQPNHDHTENDHTLNEPTTVSVVWQSLANSSKSCYNPGVPRCDRPFPHRITIPEWPPCMPSINFPNGLNTPVLA